MLTCAVLFFLLAVLAALVGLGKGPAAELGNFMFWGLVALFLMTAIVGLAPLGER